jgi:hypothetical protein
MERAATLEGQVRRRAYVQCLYLEDPRAWLAGFSGGKAGPERTERDNTMLAALIFDAVMSLPAERRRKPLLVFFYRHARRVLRHHIAEMVEGTPDRMRRWGVATLRPTHAPPSPRFARGRCLRRGQCLQRDRRPTLSWPTAPPRDENLCVQALMLHSRRCAADVRCTLFLNIQA